MKYILFCISLCLCARTFPSHFYSQCGQDRFIYENFFQMKRGGVFVDIGAHDGISLSNTYFFEQQGWSGICIEPIPEIFNQLKNNRRCLCIQGCVGKEAEAIPFLRIFGDPPNLEMLSGIVENYDPKHLERIQKNISDLGGSSTLISVRSLDLTKLLIENGIFYVDYLSIDTEGGELDILKSIDFSQIEIDVISVENNYHINGFKEFLEPLGYVLVHQLEQDEIYRIKTPRS